MWQTQEIRFAADHPTGAGHFPGNPIIPGAVLLDEVVAAIAGANTQDIAISQAKFLHILRPGDAMDLRWQKQGETTVRFECRLAGQDAIAVSGVLEIGARG